MLQKLDFEDDVQNLDEEQEPDRSYLLKPVFYWELLQRRWLYFLVPFVIIACGGLTAAKLWSAVYLSEGLILVESQLIPADLVRPTVTTAAQERIEVIEQRTMTRDNLIAIADKFNLFPDKRRFMSPSEIVALMKKNTKIVPVDPQLNFGGRPLNQAIVFSVGFESSNPQAATQVANELITRILDEDVRDRTRRASDTTQFLEREVQRLRTESNALDAKVADLQLRAAQEGAVGRPDERGSLLGRLKAEYAEKSALYSPKHPVLRALKQKIAALEKQTSSSMKDAAPAAKDSDAALAAELDAVEAQQETVQKNLDVASTKLAAARVGENLEKDQQSEKLELIEQPALPQTPIKPNRRKIAGLSLLLAAAAGAGLAFAAELADKAIRRTSDIFATVDRGLVVSIPYMATQAELRRRKRLIISVVIGIAILLIGAVIAAALLLPLDLMLAKLQVGLYR